MSGSFLQKKESKAPTTRLLNSKKPPKEPLKTETAVSKAEPSKKPTVTLKTSKLAPADSVAKQRTALQHLGKPGRLSSDLTASKGKNDGKLSTPALSAPETISTAPPPLLVPTHSETSSEESLHLDTYDGSLTPVETPREMRHPYDKNTFGRENGNSTHAEPSVVEKKSCEKEVSFKLHAPTQPPSATLVEEPKRQAVEAGGQNKRFFDKESIIQQLVNAEERNGQLMAEVARLQRALDADGNAKFVQHALLTESEVERLKQELLRERSSTRHHREAHMEALIELGKLREAVDRYGDRASLLRRNAELEARIDEMAKKTVTQDLIMAKLREETALLETRHGNSSCGSEYVTVRHASLCGLCRERLGADADRRVARDRLAQLAALEPLGVVPPPLSESWPPEVTRRLQEPREKAPSTPVPPPSGDAASLWRDAGVDAQPQHVSKEGIGSSSAASKGPCGAANIWRELPAMDGRALYYNIVTNATTFEPPALMGPASGERKGEENKGFAAIEGK
ncbi:hypothetical protein C4B63_28g131 [Trypanosoma cruzi]|uniref:WW domain-containing protein n=1 Tax=Trypanosoma cruzi TaxID=5693 RepID=A0A2V2VEN7_TRYCR|nr:hypothetical protein C4B63_28g131 [Trypanosoma cruzi]